MRYSGEIASQFVGQIVAHNVAVELLTDPIAPSLGQAEGAESNGGQNWRWIRTTRSTADPKLVRIDVTVVDQAGRKVSGLTLARPIQ